MKRHMVALAVGLSLASAAVPEGAAAAPATYCSPASLQVCAAFSASTGLVNGTWHLYLKVWNAFVYGGTTEGLSHVITFAGIGNSNWSGTGTLFSAMFNGAAVAWDNDPSPNNNQIGAEIKVGANTDNGINNGLVGCNQPIPPGIYQTCLPNGPELDLDFTTTSQFALSGAVYGWHSQAVNGTTCSLWADSKGNTTSTSLTDCVSASATPEPVSLVLLGSGMLGLGGAGLFRRRRTPSGGAAQA